VARKAPTGSGVNFEEVVLLRLVDEPDDTGWRKVSLYAAESSFRLGIRSRELVASVHGETVRWEHVLVKDEWHGYFAEYWFRDL
jgi:hypothetical protein